jgi:glutamate synthase (NADPH/NADH) large chain
MGTLAYPTKQGLYDPLFEKDACGVGFVCHTQGHPSRQIIEDGLTLLKNMKHRGAVGADKDTGDGAGMMVKIPHGFFKSQLDKQGVILPEAGNYAVGMIFLPREPHLRLYCEGVFERILREEDLGFAVWREVPVNEAQCGKWARATRPVISQVFVQKGQYSTQKFREKLYLVRKRVQAILNEKPDTGYFYVCSLSDQTLLYKGQILGTRLDQFYVDLQHPLFRSSFAIVHERYSTNTFPSWKLAHPFRYIAHNGEINTIRGNVNRMHAREGVLTSERYGDDFQKLLPIIEKGSSDSASLDNLFELFYIHQLPIEQILMIMMPENWQANDQLSPEVRAFYEYYARIFEPWDGPAAIILTDGEKIAAHLDRNGLRPLRYTLTKDQRLVVASETGVLSIDPANVERRGKLKPGEIMVCDLLKGEITTDKTIKEKEAEKYAYSDWITRNKQTIPDLPKGLDRPFMNQRILLQREILFGYTEEELKFILTPMARDGKEPVGAMGSDIPLAVMSDRPQMLFSYFKQSFAQVTNPPIDSIQERSAMSLRQYIGKHGVSLDVIEINKSVKYIEIRSPILRNQEFAKLENLYSEDFKAVRLPITFPVDGGEDRLKEALDNLFMRAKENILSGANLLILSDRNVDRYDAPIPSLLAVSALHHFLIREKLRTRVDIIVEAGDCRDVFQIALLLGYGAKAVNPYMAYEVIHDLVDSQAVKGLADHDLATKNYLKAMDAGLLKILAKMGISTLQSYNSAQIFEVVGIRQNVVDEYFTGTPTRLEGMGLGTIAKEVQLRHKKAFDPESNTFIDKGGDLFPSKGGEFHSLNSQAVKKLQKAIRTRDYALYREYAKDKAAYHPTVKIRDLFHFQERTPVPLEEVESAESIMKRFTTGAMSFGSISREAHETMAIAMNRIGAMSSSGEGGEDPARYIPDENGDWRISQSKQIASGRFGVTTDYLVHAKELQIKMAQGAKPGEGGHLPGKKVTQEIGKVRHALPGIDLISPPPHHDIYSIEDLSQLIFDLRNVNPKARINVKLVSNAGIGTVAAGVAKAQADVILISGHDGGTGAASISSMQYAGMPWELGLAEVQQTLLLNNLRNRVIIQVDGRITTGRDVLIAALLGAEEYGITTGAMIASGCILCRNCHKNVCPVGIATQDEKRRARYSGTPEDIIAYYSYVAEDLREMMAALGFRKMTDMIARGDILDYHLEGNHKIRSMDLSPVLHRPELPLRIQDQYAPHHHNRLKAVLDDRLITRLDQLDVSEKTTVKHLQIRNTDRSVGAKLSGEIHRRFDSPLADDTMSCYFTGSAGQSFGAFLTKGVTLRLDGDANDYVGKGLSGGKLIVRPHASSQFVASENVIAGNTLLYGATSGYAYFAGRAGERFAVRNSGVTAVVEGIGDHGCEYMTGGHVLILGSIGRNFAAGMSGGIAYLYDPDHEINKKTNPRLAEILPMDETDFEWVLKTLEDHQEYTGSEKAKQLLEQWDQTQLSFVKVSTSTYLEKIKETKE